MDTSIPEIISLLFVWAIAFHTGMKDEDATVLDLSRSDADRRLYRTALSTTGYAVLLLLVFALSRLF